MRHKIIPDVIHGQVVATVTPDASVRNAARMMDSRGVSSVVVIGDDDDLVGILTVRDIARRVIGAGLDVTTPVGDVMTPDPATVAADEIPLRALQAMHNGRFRHLPVVDQGHVVGVVSRRDFHDEDEQALAQTIALWEHLR